MSLIMTPERWRLVRELLASALELESSERPAYVERVSVGDPSLRAELERLLAANKDAGTTFLRDPAPFQTEDQFLMGGRSVIGLRVGAYLIMEEIGRGGMGEVYRAYRADDQYRKEVAIKLVRAGRNSESVVRRFRNERQILAGLEHPTLHGSLMAEQRKTAHRIL
jgi:serine/threonine protein kinase